MNNNMKTDAIAAMTHHGVTGVTASAGRSSHLTELRNADVLLGRGARTDQFPGNVHYRALVSRGKQAYAATDDNYRKVAIAESILSNIAERGGRFVRCLDGEEAKTLGIVDGSNAWVIVDHLAAVEKTRQALREKGYAARCAKARKTAGPALAGGSSLHVAPVTKTSVPVSDHHVPRTGAFVSHSNWPPLSGMSSGHRIPTLSQSMVQRKPIQSHRMVMALPAAHTPLSVLLHQMDRDAVERRIDRTLAQEAGMLRQELAANQQKRLALYFCEPMNRLGLRLRASIEPPRSQDVTLLAALHQSRPIRSTLSTPSSSYLHNQSFMRGPSLHGTFHSLASSDGAIHREPPSGQSIRNSVVNHGASLHDILLALRNQQQKP